MTRDGATALRDGLPEHASKRGNAAAGRRRFGPALG